MEKAPSANHKSDIDANTDPENERQRETRNRRIEKFLELLQQDVGTDNSGDRPLRIPPTIKD